LLQLDCREASEQDPFTMFLFAMNSPQTKDKYVVRLRKFFEFIGLDKLESKEDWTMQYLCRIFVEKATFDNKWLINMVIQFLQYYKHRVELKEITGATVRNYVKAMKLFLK
jgi:hypothetical protein